MSHCSSLADSFKCDKLNKEPFHVRLHLFVTFLLVFNHYDWTHRRCEPVNLEPGCVCVIILMSGTSFMQLEFILPVSITASMCVCAPLCWESLFNSDGQLIFIHTQSNRHRTPPLCSQRDHPVLLGERYKLATTQTET